MPPKVQRKNSFWGRKKKGGEEKSPLLGSAADTRPVENAETIHYDLCFVFINPDHEDHAKFKGHESVPPEKQGAFKKAIGDDATGMETYRDFVSKCLYVGLSVHSYLSVQEDEVYVQVGAPLQRLKDQADILDYKVEMNAAALKVATEAHFKTVLAQDPEDMIDGEGPRLGDADGRFGTYDHIFCEYDTEESIQGLYKHAVGLSHPFHSTHRIKLLISMIQGENFRGGADINIGACCDKEECIDPDAPAPYGPFGTLSYFPLHDATAVNDLYSKWVVTWQWPGKQPVDMLRMYLGEKAGLYFGFLCHYTKWLIGIGFAGLCVQLDTLTTYPSVEASSVPFFAVFVCVWAVLMLEDWKNAECKYALEWGMSDFESTEQDRPEFYGQLQWSPVNGERVTYYPDNERAKAVSKSTFKIFLMLILVLASISGVFMLKIVLSTGNEYVYDVVPSLVQAIVIQILNAIYRGMAKDMTIEENHQTDTQYEDSLVAKLYMFTFVNSYAALYFMAFIQGYTELGCDKGNCMDDLAYTMVILFCTNLFVGTALEIVVPIMNARAAKAAEGGDGEEAVPMSVAELQYILETYDPMESTIEDYTTISIELGYVVLFAVAFPLAPFLACLCEYLQIRIDGLKLCRLYKRCEPVGAQDIGIWLSIFTLTTYASVISNAGIVMFTGDWFGELELSTRIWMFIGFQYVLGALMSGIDAAIPDTPEDVEIQVERAAFFQEYVLNKKEVEVEKITFSDYAAQHKAPHEVVYSKRADPSQYFESLEGSVFVDY